MLRTETSIDRGRLVNPQCMLDLLLNYEIGEGDIEGNVLVLGATYLEIERLKIPGINPIGLSSNSYEVEKYRGQGVVSDFNSPFPIKD